MDWNPTIRGVYVAKAKTQQTQKHVLVPAHQLQLLRSDPGGNAPADAADLLAGKMLDVFFGLDVHRRIRHLRDRIDRQGHGDLLVAVRTGGDPDAHPDRRYGRYHHRSHPAEVLGQEDRSVAQEHHAGIDLGAARRRNRPTDGIHPQDLADHRAGGRAAAHSGILQRFRLLEGDMVLAVPFDLGVL